ncbi:hypothetical protein PIB30_088437 [Stylosanthes scabra]|uniref:Uncharacterized protein n=1 Tax=Stylosanthes scabra TaxID=79078 RepID=A0ABU6VSU8_9FABA|nr:hypothetical protein [Stylosanthes scabra]
MIEPRQPLFGEQPDNLTSPAIPIDDGELALERTELIPTVIEVGPHLKTARGQEADFTEESDDDENNELADLKATSSKALLNKLMSFEMNRRQIAKERQNYGIQEVSSGAAQDKGMQGELSTKGMDKGKPKFTATQSKIKEGETAKLKVAPSRLNEGEFGAEGVNKL